MMVETTPTATVVVQTPSGQLPFQVFNNPLCLEITRSILEGRTYPCVHEARDVKVVVDIGANLGAASLYFALAYPQARVFSFEPAAQTYSLLRQNLASFANVATFDFGLYDRDCQLPLYLSKEDPVTNSVFSSYLNTSRFVEIQLKNARAFFRHQQIEAIDILKVDTEGCELPIVHSLADLVEKTQVIYLEYHDEDDRLALDALLRRSHILVGAKLRHPHRGELCYVSYRSFPSPAALEKLRICSAAPPTCGSSAPRQEIITTAPPLGSSPQDQFDVAVVMPSILRSSLKRAVQSVFGQRLKGPAQLLIGVDRRLGDASVLDEIRALKPDHWALSVFDPGYSTSIRHGGLHSAKDGGALRTILSYAANSRYLAYLDDDNWWSPDHLPSLLAAIPGYEWAYSKRWFVDSESLESLCEDTWESVGPGHGVFQEKCGGFVDPNTMLLDKLACESVLRLWAVSIKGDRKGMSADRNVFRALRTRFRSIATQQPTCFYVLDPKDAMHPARLRRIRHAQQRPTPLQP